MKLLPLLKLTRPSHWIKNLVLFIPLIFGTEYSDLQSWLRVAVAAAAFCAASSFAYIINDIADREVDRRHPRKSKRPLAAGTITTATAVVQALILLAAASVLAYELSLVFFLVLAGYVGLQLSYSSFLKHLALIDVICIALGFVLRAVGGAVALPVSISPWLFICLFTFCLFMGFCKRYSETVVLGDLTSPEKHRATLIAYTPQLLTHLITVSAGIAIVAFLQYAMHPRTVENFGTHYFVYTLPVVVYGVFRFAMLSMKGAYQDPTDLIFNDRPFQFSVAVWGGLAIMIITYGRNISAWIGDGL